jgi:hypothetical protein
MHWYSNRLAPLSGGRPLAARSADAALSEAAALWSAGTHSTAIGYVVIDTDDGTTLFRHER